MNQSWITKFNSCKKLLQEPVSSQRVRQTSPLLSHLPIMTLQLEYLYSQAALEQPQKDPDQSGLLFQYTSTKQQLYLLALR